MPDPVVDRLVEPAVDPVVITRPRAQADALAERVRAAGREPVLLPLLDIAPLDDDSALRAVLNRLADFAMVAFVSPNAIDAAFAHLDGWPSGVTLAVLGEGSRAALLRHGVDERCAHIVSPPDNGRSDSESLLASLDLRPLAGRQVLIVRGESGRELMADGLRAAGAVVTTVAAYKRSVPVLDAALSAQLLSLLERPHDWIITSSEALRGLLALVDAAGGAPSVTKLQQQHLIVPHERIAETATALGFTRLTQSGSGDERLLAALQSRA